MKLSIPPNFFSDGCLANSPDSLIVDGWIECDAKLTKLTNARGHVVDADAFRAFERRACYAARSTTRDDRLRRAVALGLDSGASRRRVRRADSTIRGFDATVGSRSDRF
jgi:hypothetical protein